MAFKTIVTLGPAILDETKLKKIDRQGACIYRVNGSHAKEEELPDMVRRVKKVLPCAKIMLDLPGNKIRTTNLSEPIRLVRGESFVLYDYQVNYPKFYTKIRKGDRIFANDSIFSFEVLEKSSSRIKMLSHSDGLLLSNKGLHVRGIHEKIPFIFEKDHKLLRLAAVCGIDYLAISFVRTAEDIRAVKKLIKGKDFHLIAKIETSEAVKNLERIFSEVDSILIDRGDLSTEIDILKLAVIQERIIETALLAKKNVYLATQFLKNMEIYPVPLISEVIDLCRTIKSGISGIQLSEETAVGKYPVECVSLVFNAFKSVLSENYKGNHL